LNQMVAGAVAGRREVRTALREASEAVEALLARAGYFQSGRSTP